MAPDPVLHIADDSALAEVAKSAVHLGDIDRLSVLLAEHPELATARIGSTGISRTMLHVATDWPGHFPRVAESIKLLVAAGADVDAGFVGGHVAAIDALLDAGANIEAWSVEHRLD